MKRTTKKKVAIALALSSIPLLTGCGSGNQNNNVNGIPGSVYGTGSCIPISAAIPFSATNIYFDYANIRGGQIPNSQTIGSMAVGGAVAGGPYQRSGVDGTISMNIVPVSQATYPANPSYPGYTQPSYNGAATTASATGVVTIASATQQDILYQAQMGAFGNIPGMTGYPTTTYPTYPGTVITPTATSSLCVSGIAIDVGHYNNTIYGGHVFLYLNNTQHGYALYF